MCFCSFFQDARRKGAVPLPLTSVSTTLQLSGDVLARLPMLQRCSVAEQLLRAVRAGAADADVRGLDCFYVFRVSWSTDMFPILINYL